MSLMSSGRLMLLLVAGMASCSRSEAHRAAEPRVVAVRAVAVVNEELTRPILASGVLAPKDEIALGFKVGGVIAAVQVDAGTVVRAGQPLATLDPREIDAGVSRAQSAADKAQRDFDRAARLYRDSVVTRVQLSDAETALRIAHADLEAARFNRRYASIISPADGVILRRLAEPGEVVAAGASVLVLGSRARGSVVRVGLADRDVVHVTRGDAATVRFDALPERRFEGTVSEIAAAADPGTGTYLVEVSLAAAGGLPAGLIASVELRPAGSVQAAVVPLEAVLEADGRRATVYALSPDGAHAERREVTVAFIDGNRVAVRSGLEGVRAVLTDGAAYLRDGAAVRVLQ